MSASIELPSPISFPLWGSDEEVTFNTVADVIDWARNQDEAWIDISTPIGTLAQTWNVHRSHAKRVLELADQIIEKSHENDIAQLDVASSQVDQSHMQLHKLLSQYANGNLISTAHPQFFLIQAVAEADPSSAVVLLTACLSGGHEKLTQLKRLDAITRVGAAVAQLDSSRKKTIKSLRAELSSLKKRAENDLNEIRATLAEQKAQSLSHDEQHKALIDTLNQNWEETFRKYNSEWHDLKHVYDEKLALLAPTEYWRTRSVVHNKKARNYAIAFSLALALMVAAFLLFGIKHLGDPATGSVVLTLLPVLIPAFAAVWILRILGRLLSENLKISQDAHERETLVKTFLALMRDDTTGKSVVTDDDRTLILHALFRQSTVTAVDDAPPLHWLEAFRRSKP